MSRADFAPSRDPPASPFLRDASKDSKPQRPSHSRGIRKADQGVPKTKPRRFSSSPKSLRVVKCMNRHAYENSAMLPRRGVRSTPRR